MAESTGRLPPTPTDHTDTREISVREFWDAPATTAKIPMIRKVRLKDMLDSSQKRSQSTRMPIPTTPNICTNAPEYGTSEKANVLP